MDESNGLPNLCGIHVARVSQPTQFLSQARFACFVHGHTVNETFSLRYGSHLLFSSCDALFLQLVVERMVCLVVCMNLW